MSVERYAADRHFAGLDRDALRRLGSRAGESVFISISAASRKPEVVPIGDGNLRAHSPVVVPKYAKLSGIRLALSGHCLERCDHVAWVLSLRLSSGTATHELPGSSWWVLL